MSKLTEVNITFAPHWQNAKTYGSSDISGSNGGRTIFLLKDAEAAIKWFPCVRAGNRSAARFR